MTLNKPKNRSYAAVVVALKDFVNLPNCDNVKGALIFGNHVIVSKDVQEGEIGIYFPVETAISKNFLGPNNLYRKAEFGNEDPEKKGFFEEHGRVKAVKFRGHASSGFWIPLESMTHLKNVEGTSYIDLMDEVRALKVGDEFDEIGGVPICQKYIRRSERAAGTSKAKVKGAKKPKVEDLLVDGQFRFHYDTAQLRRNAFKIMPDSIVSVTDKWHGTSIIVGNLLTKVEPTWFERLVARFGVRLKTHAYGATSASRRVIKNVNGEAKSGAIHYYSSDIWGHVGQEIQDRIPKGYTVYGEVVGFTPDGGWIQKGYHYGCNPGEHKLLIYRVTVTNEDGQVTDLGYPAMKEFCQRYGFEPVVELFYGKAEDFVLAYHPNALKEPGEAWEAIPSIRSSDERHQAEFGDLFTEALEFMYLEKPCKYNRNEVPAEGVVVRLDHFEEAEAYKLKSFLFLKKESEGLDKGDEDLEAQEEAEALEAQENEG